MGSLGADIAAVVQPVLDALNAAGYAVVGAAQDTKALINKLSTDYKTLQAVITNVFNPKSGQFAPAAVAAFKAFLIKEVGTLITDNGPSGDYGLLFGGATALTSVLNTAFSEAARSAPTA